MLDTLPTYTPLRCLNSIKVGFYFQHPLNSARSCAICSLIKDVKKDLSTRNPLQNIILSPANVSQNPGPNETNSENQTDFSGITLLFYALHITLI